MLIYPQTKNLSAFSNVGITEEELISLIEKLNNDKEVDGILVQLPISKYFNVEKVINSINPNKDVDGLSSYNVDRLDNKLDGLVPCTPLGVIEMLKYYDIEISGKNVVVAGVPVVIVPANQKRPYAKEPETACRDVLLFVWEFGRVEAPK